MCFSEKVTAYFSFAKKIINICESQEHDQVLKKRKRRSACKQKNTYLFKPKIDPVKESKQINKSSTQLADALKAQRKSTSYG